MKEEIVMSQMQKKQTKAERKKLLARIVCLAIAVVMIGSVLMAAVFSRIY